MPERFQPFSLQHFAALAVGAAVAVVLIRLGRRGGAGERFATRFLAALNFAVLPLNLLAWWSVAGAQPLDHFVPGHLCDVAAITAGLALLTRRPLLCALTYFWGLAATIQGLATPAITVAFPALPFVMFFVHHFVVVISALYLPLALGWRPEPPWWRAPIQVFGWSLLYLAGAMLINHLLGSNFAFATRPPDNPSLIDHLGPWPWYLLSIIGLALALFFLLALPFARSRPRGPQP